MKKYLRLIIEQLHPKKKFNINTDTTISQIAKEIFGIAIILHLVLESLSHRSILDGILTIVNNPAMFLCSVSLLSFFLSIGLLLPKRHFGYSIVAFIWLWLGTIDFILLSFRTTPLTAMDFKLLTSVITVINRYLNSFQMILVGIVFILLTMFMVGVGVKLPYTKIHWRKGILTIGFSFVLLLTSFNVAIKANAVSTNFGNIANAFLDYGFAYSFSTSVIDKGIQKPKTYSKVKIGEVLDVIGKERESQSMSMSPKTINEQWIKANAIRFPKEVMDGDLNSEAPYVQDEPQATNIILIQLESFFDVKRLKAFDYNQDPLPNMTRLKEDYSSGYVTVPSIGAGTANTEFEMLSGMSLDYFGAGEYPYKTILKKTTVESLPYTLTELGYHNHAIHNNMGTFYSRSTVYPRLGFDSFSSIEYMNGIEYNPLNWAKDEILIPEINKALTATPSQDFVFGVSVQPHGKYPEEALIENPDIIPYVMSELPQMINDDQDSSSSSMANNDNNQFVRNTDMKEPPTNLIQLGDDKLFSLYYDNMVLPFEPDSQSDDSTALILEEISKLPSSMDVKTYYQYLYFVNQIYEEDQFVGDLIESLEDFPEPVVVIFYGDHMPTLDIDDEDLTDGTPFQMDYVMWDNIGLERIEEDLSSYQMGAMITERLGYDEGLLNSFHQTMKNDPDYEEELELLQYDVLYGNRNAYGGINPFKKKKMTMGVYPIEVTRASIEGEVIYVNGENFTPWSEVNINGELVETYFINENVLIVPDQNITVGTKVKVSQITKTGWKLSSTKTYKVTEADL